MQPIYGTPVPAEPKVLQPSGKHLMPVKEGTMYPEQFPIWLRERLQGLTHAQAAAQLEIPTEQLERLLDGHWKPSKAICRKIGLKMVYAVTEKRESAAQ